MAGWVLSISIWFIFLSAIYFIGHLNLNLIDQEYRSFQTAMLSVKTQQELDIGCEWVQAVGNLMSYEHCARTWWGDLKQTDMRQAHLQDLAIATNRLAQAELSYRQPGTNEKAFSYFLEIIPKELQLDKSLVILADDGSSPSLTSMQSRLQASQQTWGGVLREAKQDFNDYEQHINKTDGVWRALGSSDWLGPWLTEAPSNELERD